MPQTSVPGTRVAERLDAAPESLHLSDRSRRLDALSAYRHAWNACLDESVVRFWLARCWGPESCYINPFSDPIRGLDALVRLMLDYQLLFPGVHIRPTRPVAFCRRHGHYSWALSSSVPIRIRGRDFGLEMTGHDVVSFSRLGTISLAVTLIDGLDPCG